jgi:hypothetical protein
MIFRGSLGAGKFLTRMLSLILRGIFFSLGKKKIFFKKLLRPFLSVNSYYYLKCLFRQKDILHYTAWCNTVHALILEDNKYYFFFFFRWSKCSIYRQESRENKIILNPHWLVSIVIFLTFRCFMYLKNNRKHWIPYMHAPTFMRTLSIRVRNWCTPWACASGTDAHPEHVYQFLTHMLSMRISFPIFQMFICIPSACV